MGRRSTGAGVVPPHVFPLLLLTAWFEACAVTPVTLRCDESAHPPEPGPRRILQMVGVSFESPPHPPSYLGHLSPQGARVVNLNPTQLSSAGFVSSPRLFTPRARQAAEPGKQSPALPRSCFSRELTIANAIGHGLPQLVLTVSRAAQRHLDGGRPLADHEVSRLRSRSPGVGRTRSLDSLLWAPDWFRS